MKKSAFSLLELSIALTIIGLLVAGISAGSKFIVQSKYSKMVTQMHDIALALKTFHITYDAFPGDMTNAETYWTTYNSSSNPTGTKNGDGDGLIKETIVSGERESLRAWQQLADKTHLLPSSYDGIGANTGTDIAIGTEVPAMPFTGMGINFVSKSASTAGTWYTGGGNFTRHGKKQNVSSAEYIRSASFTEEEAYLFDKKFDDAQQFTGKIRAEHARNSDDDGDEACAYTSFGSTDECVIIRRY